MNNKLKPACNALDDYYTASGASEGDLHVVIGDININDDCIENTIQHLLSRDGWGYYEEYEDDGEE